MKSPSLTWNLDVIFPGGSASTEFADFLALLERDIAAFDASVEAGAEALVALIERWQQLLLRMREANGFVTCLQAQNARDREAVALSACVQGLRSALSAASGRFDHVLVELPEERWNELLTDPQLRPIAAALSARRARAAEKLAPATEALIGALAIDGYHGWSALYRTLAGAVRVPFEGEQLSVAQAENRLAHGDRAERAQLFENYQAAWVQCAAPCADALNHLAGFRWQTYRQRGWNCALKESLDANRISSATLQAMWRAVREGDGLLGKFLGRKARLLGLEKLEWPDIEAPVRPNGRRFSYPEASELIVASFGRFDARMAAFAARALEGGWVDAEVRPSKRNGGFSKTLPLSRQSRVLVSFGGSLANVFTLAHELGHAYHQELMVDLPAIAQPHPMTLAESASTFAERLVFEGAYDAARDEQERLALLEASAGRAVSYLRKMRARFEFETAFYAERAAGRVSVERLNELCVEAQRAAFGAAVASHHPPGWTATRHFFFTDQPFYNFPYTFGFLLSAQLDARRRAQGDDFGARYAEFLRASGTLNVEELGREFLDADLRTPDFWREAIALALREAEQFLQATDESQPAPERRV